MSVCWVPFGLQQQQNKKTPQRWCCSPSGPLYRPPRISPYCQCTGKYPHCMGIKRKLPKHCTAHKQGNQTKRARVSGFSRALILTVFRSVCVVITLAVVLLSMPVAVVVARPCAVQCLVTGRPVRGCNNPAPTAHAPDSMLLKVLIKRTLARYS